jgi:outer membrane protein assembly factor BamD
MQKYLRVLALSCAITLVACSTESETAADVFKGQSAEQIYQSAEKALDKKRYKESIKDFEGLSALYPFSEYEPKAQLDVIYAYYMAEDYLTAAAAADRYTRLYPRAEHVDYAYFMKGMAQYQTNRGFASKYFNLDLAQRDLANAQQAFDDFNRLIQLFPDSKYVPNARARMVNLRNLMALHEVEVAEYYMQHNAYVAAVNRANYVVEHYQTSPAVISALGVLVKAYRALGMTDLANQTLTILQYNYPNSEVYQQLASTKPQLNAVKSTKTTQN